MRLTNWLKRNRDAELADKLIEANRAKPRPGMGKVCHETLERSGKQAWRDTERAQRRLAQTGGEA